MKRIFYISILIFGFISCQKDINQTKQDFLRTIQSSLKDSLPGSLFTTLDFEKSVLSQVDSINLFITRIPFIGKKMENDFVVIKTDLKGTMQTGKLIHLEGAETEYRNGRLASKSFNGKITISSLNQMNIINSPIEQGYIKAFHQPNNLTRTEILPSQPAGDVLPEVVVVAYVSSSGGISYSDWIALQSYFYDSGGSGGSSGNYYSPTSGGGGGSSSGSSTSGTPITSSPKTVTGGGIQQVPVINIKVETYVNHPAIDINKYLKCFDAIPDAGSVCSVEIYSDLPVDGDPTKMFDWKTESPGHCFLQIKKSNGNLSTVQNIGFYPNTNWKNILDANPVDSKFVDDANHEFDASLKMKLTTYQLRNLIQKMSDLAKSGLKYDMDEFNCTDFALEVFNSVRTFPINIVKVNIPGGMAINGSNTPQGLYLTLQQMKNSNALESSNITIGNSYNWVSASNGPCN
ncbi:MAG: hypothetical protein ACJ748_08705 [Flavisolibacter sp.]